MTSDCAMYDFVIVAKISTSFFFERMIKRSIKASRAGISIAKEAMIDRGLNQQKLAINLSVHRQTVNKFFTQKPVAPDTFVQICKHLKLEWKEIAEIEKEEQQHIPNESDEGKAEENNPNRHSSVNHQVISIQSIDDSEISSSSSTTPKSWRRDTRRVRPIISSYRTLSRSRLSRKEAQGWLRSKSEQLVIEVCNATLCQYSGITDIEKECFQTDILYYLDLVICSIELGDSIVYHLENMENYFSLNDISLYIQTFEQIGAVTCRNASLEISRESVAQIELRIRELINYIDTLL